MDNSDSNPTLQTRFLNEIESKAILEQTGIAVTRPVLARSKAEAVSAARSIGFPVVFKIVSPDIVHKSDCGGVITGIADEDSAGLAFERMMSGILLNFPDARIEGISVQPQAAPGTEIILGMSRDPQFGPAIMFGLGGVWVELLNDVSIRIAPLTREDAAEMVQEIKGYKLLRGFRGNPGVDTDTLEDWILKISALAMANPGMKELDINPVFAYESGALAVDARILFDT